MSLAAARETCKGDGFRVLVSDVCQVAAILLVLVSVAVGTVSPKPSYSWSVALRYFSPLSSY